MKKLKLKNKKYFNQFILIIIFLSLFNNINSQDIVVPLSINPSVKAKPSINKKLKGSLQSVNLPFFDDFSNPQMYDSCWTDRNVFVNDNFAVNAMSIGVATFDGLDKNGHLYTRASDNLAFYADTLTSVPINLGSLHTNDNIYLSFFYQPAGNGETPDSGDSLVVQFYSSSLQKWTSVWSMPGDSIQPFKIAMLQITDTSYLHDGFRFRFYNRASLYISTNSPGKNTNGDIWNIDYVMLDKNRSIEDTTFRDVAIIKPSGSLLRYYESMPLRQFKPNLDKELEVSQLVSVRCLYTNDNANEVILTYNIKEILSSNEYIDYEPFGSELGVPADLNIYSMIGELPQLITDQPDTALYQIKTFIEPSGENNRDNDTIVYYQKFSNYFAYDDGSAEKGYGLSGEGADNGLIAYKFQAKLEDSLYAVDIYFNEALLSKESESFDKHFFLTVWDDNNGIPNDTIYKKSLENYVYKPGWQRLYLDTAISIGVTYYVGLTQRSAYFLNIGFDINNITEERIYYNLQGTPSGWTKSSQKGALMIRPVVGPGKLLKRPISVNSLNKELILFPNPAFDYVNIKLENSHFNDRFNVLVLDMMGRPVQNSVLKANSIDISKLNPGLYFIQLRNNKGLFYSGKFIKINR